jgi:GNAT superfamily N-acetyltransferase
MIFFQKYVPKPWKLYEIRLDMFVVYYIGDKLLTLSEFKHKAKSLPAYIETVWDFSLKEMTVLFVNSSVQGKGLGTLLLSAVIITAGNEGIEKVTLDDVSNNYRKRDNIYLKLGFRYEKKFGPEMKGTTKCVSRKWRIISKKY